MCPIGDVLHVAPRRFPDGEGLLAGHIGYSRASVAIITLHIDVDVESMTTTTTVKIA